MKSPKAKMIRGNLYFNRFMVQKESDNFYGVYEHSFETKFDELITSGTSMDSAAKKAKLLQIGYDIRKNME